MIILLVNYLTIYFSYTIVAAAKFQTIYIKTLITSEKSDLYFTYVNYFIQN